MLKSLDDLVERRIRDAQREGQFDSLPGAGRPLVLDDDTLVPPEVRAAYRVLKNAGFVPPEVEALREQARASGPRAGTGLPDDRGREARRGTRRLLALTVALERHGVRLTTQAAQAYRQALVERLGRGPGDKENDR
jgi:hypothetical protein